MRPPIHLDLKGSGLIHVSSSCPEVMASNYSHSINLNKQSTNHILTPASLEVLFV